MCNEVHEQDVESLRLPKGWATNVRHAILNIMGIVRIAMLAGRETLIRIGDIKDARIHQLETELAMTREELRLIGDRMRRVTPHRRPQYTIMERMAILELRAIRGWNKAETARHFHVSDDTIRAWLRRIDDDSLVQTRTPVNRFPDLVRYVVQQIKLFCPALGKAKIADTLTRAGIHIGGTTVQRMLKEKPAGPAEPSPDDTGTVCRIVSKYPSHTWHADLTTVPISGGFWTNWLPHAIWQRWPVCWWVLNVVDHYSRRCMGFAVFEKRPTSAEVTSTLTRIMFAERIRPKHLIVDQGPEFKCDHFENSWCKALNILPRFGAIGKHGSIAVVERFHRTMKEILRQITVPENQSGFERELRLIVDWFNEHRPHETLGGKTPNEVYFSRPPASEQPRFEPRRRWPRGLPCAKPQVGVKGEPGDPVIVLEIDCFQGRRHLPVIRARRAA
jgi:transposase InsO family protein